jgi:hypothetical protein
MLDQKLLVSSEQIDEVISGKLDNEFALVIVVYVHHWNYRCICKLVIVSEIYPN